MGAPPCGGTAFLGIPPFVYTLWSQKARPPKKSVCNSSFENSEHFDSTLPKSKKKSFLPLFSPKMSIFFTFCQKKHHKIQLFSDSLKNSKHFDSTIPKLKKFDFRPLFSEKNVNFLHFLRKISKFSSLFSFCVKLRAFW